MPLVGKCCKLYVCRGRSIVEGMELVRKSEAKVDKTCKSGLDY